MIFLQNNQVEIMRILGYVCLLLTLFTGMLKDSSFRRKCALMIIEFSAAVLMFANILNYQFLGDTSEKGIVIEPISNFLIFMTMFFVLYGFTSYISTLIMGIDKLSELPKSLWACKVLCYIYACFVMLSQSFHFFYYFDEQNMYQRGPLYVVGFAIPFMIFATQLVTIVKYRAYISNAITISLFIFAILPIASAVLQVTVFTGTSPMDISVGFAAIILYCFSLVEQNSSLIKAGCMDRVTGLPNEAGFQRAINEVCIRKELDQYDIFYFCIAKMGKINIMYGAKMGDNVIQSYAQYIRSHISERDIFARLGGNYFVALIQKKECKEFIQRLMDIPVSILVEEGGKQLHVSSMVGAYEIPEKAVNVDTVIGNAIAAFHYTKNVYDNSVLYLTDEVLEQLRAEENDSNADTISLLMKHVKVNK